MLDSIQMILVLIVLAILPVAIIKRSILTLKKREFPFSDKLMRPPGYSVKKKLDNYIFDSMSYLVVSVFLAYIASTFIFSKNVFLIIIGIGVVVIELALLSRLYNNMKKVFSYHLGYAGELAVGQSLNQLMLDGYHVFHDLQVGESFNLDHVIVGSNGVFSIETKARSKSIDANGKKIFKVEYNGSALFFDDKPNIPHTKFLKQAQRQAQWLRNELTSSTGYGVKVIPVLVLPGWNFTLKIDQNSAEVKLLNHNKLDALKKLNTGIKLDNSDITRIIHQLRQKCKDLDMNKGRWGR